MRKSIAVLLFVGAQGVAGCGDSTAPRQVVSGFWQGLLTGNQVLSMTILENSGIVTGTGTLTNTPSGTRAQTVSGTFANGMLDATFTSGTAAPFILHATYGVVTIQGMQAPQLTGTINGSGFNAESVILTKYQSP